jgi:hypothetical protein
VELELVLCRGGGTERLSPEQTELLIPSHHPVSQKVMFTSPVSNFDDQTVRCEGEAVRRRLEIAVAAGIGHRISLGLSGLA